MEPRTARTEQALLDAVRLALRPGPFASLLAFSTLPNLVFGAPTGGQVAAGTASISTPDAYTTTIDQATASAVINWQTFSVAGDEYVIFNQPGASAVTLNRVVGGDPSSILGNITANGQVFLVNPAGLFFGPGATLDVAGLVASTLDIADEDFMSGNYQFFRAPDAVDGAAVVNEGNIQAAEGGYVVLMGDRAENTGLIQARLGHIVLAAGAEMTLDISGDGLVNFAIDESTLAEAAGVENAGVLMADGGRVIMSADVAHDLAATVVNNEGLVQARGIEEQDGAVFLVGTGGDVVNEGAIDASGTADQDGGVAIVYSTEDVELVPGSEIHADGAGAGDGGVVRVIAEDTLEFQEGAVLSAQAGEAGQSGGFIEVSGYEGLALQGEVQLGQGGELLIDPLTLTLVAGVGSPGGSTISATVGVGFVEGVLQGGAGVTLAATDLINASVGVTSLDGRNTAGTGGALNVYIGSPPGTATPNCLSFGVCPGGTVITPDASGTINLSNVDIFVDGAAAFYAGSTAGTVQVGNVQSEVAVGIYAQDGATAGSLTVLDDAGTALVVVAGTTAGAAMNGPVSTGPISVTRTGLDSGAIFINTLDTLTITGDVDLETDNLLGLVRLTGDQGLSVGNVTVTHTAGSAVYGSASLNAASGSVTAGSVTVSVRNVGLAQINGATGISVGNISLTGVNANAGVGATLTASGASADINAGSISIVNTHPSDGGAILLGIAAGNDISVSDVTLDGGGGTAVDHGTISFQAAASNGNAGFGTINASAGALSFVVLGNTGVSVGDINATALDSLGIAQVNLVASGGTADLTAGNLTVRSVNATQPGAAGVGVAATGLTTVGDVSASGALGLVVVNGADGVSAGNLTAIASASSAGVGARVTVNVSGDNADANLGSITASNTSVGPGEIGVTAGRDINLTGDVRAVSVNDNATVVIIADDLLTQSAATTISVSGGVLANAVATLSADTVMQLGSINVTGSGSSANVVQINVTATAGDASVNNLSVSAPGITNSAAADINVTAEVGNVIANGLLQASAAGNLASVTLQAGSASSGNISGTASISADVINLRGQTMTVGSLTAANDITLNTDAVSLIVNGTVTEPSVSFDVSGLLSISSSITATTGDVSLTGGAVTLGGDTDPDPFNDVTIVATTGAISITGDIGSSTNLAGTVSMSAVTDIDMVGDIYAGGLGAVSLTAGSNLSYTGSISSPSNISMTASSGKLSVGAGALNAIASSGTGTIMMFAGTDATIDASLTAVGYGGQVDISAGGKLTLNGAVAASGTLSDAALVTLMAGAGVDINNAVTATSTGTAQASITVNATGGDINVGPAGSLSASGMPAQISISAATGNVGVFGPVTAHGGDNSINRIDITAGGTASIDAAILVDSERPALSLNQEGVGRVYITAGTGVNIAGGITAKGKRDAGISIDAGTGDLMTTAAILASASSWICTPGPCVVPFGVWASFVGNDVTVGGTVSAAGTVGQTNVYVDALNDATLSGSISVSGPGAVAGGPSIAVFAGNDIKSTAGAKLNVSGSAAQVSMSAGGNISASGSITGAGGGSAFLGGAGYFAYAGGDVALNANVDLTATGSAGAAWAYVGASGSVTLGGSLNLLNTAASGAARATFSAGFGGTGNVALNGNVTATASSGVAAVNANASNGSVSQSPGSVITAVGGGSGVFGGSGAAINVNGATGVNLQGSMSATVVGGPVTPALINIVPGTGAPVTVNNLTASNQAVGGDAKVLIASSGAPAGSVNITGAVLADANPAGNDALVEVFANGDITTAGPVTASAGTGTASVLFAAGQNIFVGSNVTAAGPGTDTIFLGTGGFAPTGSITGGAFIADKVQITASDANVDVTVDTPMVNVNGAAALALGFAGSGSLTISGSPSMGVLDLSFGGDGTVNGPFFANAIAMNAVGDLTVNSVFGVGSGSAPGFSSDSLLQDALAASGIQDGGGQLVPNAGLRAGGLLTVEVGGITQTDAYLYMQADVLALTGTASADGLLVHFQPFTDTNDIRVEDLLPTPSPGVTDYARDAHFDHFVGTTIAIGGDSFDGSILVGSSGNLFVDPKNLLFLGLPGTTSVSNLIITTGIVCIDGFCALPGSQQPPVLLQEVTDQYLPGSESDDGGEVGDGLIDIIDGGVNATSLRCT